jgi:thiol:disulfide interchange protein DsbD
MRWFNSILFITVLSLSFISGAQTVSERLQSIGGLLNRSAEQQFLHPDEAFVLSPRVVAPDRISVNVIIAEGYYLYHDKFSFEVTEGDARVNSEQVSIPPGKTKEDPSFGSVEVNTEVFDIEVPVLREAPDAMTITLQYGYQGCKDESLCYPPIKKTTSLQLPQSNELVSLNAVVSQAAIQGEAGQPVLTTLSEQDSITQRLLGGSVLLSLVMFFGAGLLLSLTPCVFPMIPILSGIIAGQEKGLTSSKGFMLSLVYVLAMALTYAIVGVIAAMAGINVQAAAQDPWIIAVLCLVLIALALSMFGFYEIQLPSVLQEKLTSLSNSRQGGTLTGVAIMGAISAVIVGPCVAPPLVGALTYISQTGDEVLGGAALFSMGMGMGVPLLIIGGSAGSILPRAGPWMETIKQIFGVALIGLAIWFLARVVSPAIELFLWGALFIITAIYMGALDQLDSHATWRRLWKGTGLIMLLYGMTLVIGAFSGSRNIYQPLAGIFNNGPVSRAEQGLEFARIKTMAELNNSLQRATSQGRPVMLDFYADWCIECIRMENNIFHQDEVIRALSGVVLLRADVTDNDDEDKALLKHFNIYGPPAIMFFGQKGKERKEYRLYGYVEADEFSAHVVRATAPAQ